MKIITIDQVRQKAKSWLRKGKKWHFHVLFPDCAFNTVHDQYALVLEDRTNCQTFVAYDDKGFAKISQELLKMRYGENILDTSQSPAASTKKPAKPILERCQTLVRDNIPWHHHLLFPDCIFNSHAGKWNLVLESGDESQAMNALYDEEPVEDLQKLEIEYFKEIDPTFK
jgi:hypothetical protein